MPDSSPRFPVELELAVAWGDMDAFGHVNNTVYLRWFESGRIAYFRAVGIEDGTRQASVGPILARATCDFKIPLEFPDTVTIRSRIAKLGTTSFTMGYEVCSAAHEGKIAALGEGVVVMFDYEQASAVPIPRPLRERISALEERAP